MESSKGCGRCVAKGDGMGSVRGQTPKTGFVAFFWVSPGCASERMLPEEDVSKAEA